MCPGEVPRSWASFEHAVTGAAAVVFHSELFGMPFVSRFGGYRTLPSPSLRNCHSAETGRKHKCNSLLC